MSEASHRPATRAEPLADRSQPWIAALASALVHLLFLLALLYSSKVTLTPPESGSSGGARVKVDFIGETRDDDQRPPVPPTGTARPSERPRPRKPLVTTPVTSPVQSTRVTEADDPVAPEEKPQEQAPDEAVAAQHQTLPPASRSTPAWRRSARWGQPPGMLAQETSHTNTGLDQGTARSQGRGPGAAATQPTMEVGGHQIYYDLRNEIRLRDWRDRGMTELSFPLPGIRQYMVCPLEIVLRRGSGGCRLVEPEDPEMALIGDARDVVSVERVYRRGELVWRGPGAYR